MHEFLKSAFVDGATLTIYLTNYRGIQNSADTANFMNLKSNDNFIYTHVPVLLLWFHLPER